MVEDIEVSLGWDNTVIVLVHAMTPEHTDPCEVERRIRQIVSVVLGEERRFIKVVLNCLEETSGHPLSPSAVVEFAVVKHCEPDR